MISVTGGSTDVSLNFKLRLKATGLEATGLTIADLDLQYTRVGEVPTAKVDAVALAATNTAHTDNRAIELDATDQPGVYRVDWPDAAFVAGVREVILTVNHASCFSVDLRVLIDAPVNATKWRGEAIPATSQTGVPVVDVVYVNGTGATPQTFPTNFESLAINVSGHIERVVLVDTTTTNTDMRGTDSAATAAALASLVTTVGAAGAGLTEAGGDGDHLTAIPWNAAWDAEVQSECIDALQETVPDTIPADGSRPNMQQAAYMQTQYLTERAITDTTMNVYKPDGSTVLYVIALNDATTPTAHTRSS